MPTEVENKTLVERMTRLETVVLGMFALISGEACRVGSAEEVAALQEEMGRLLNEIKDSL